MTHAWRAWLYSSRRPVRPPGAAAGRIAGTWRKERSGYEVRRFRPVGGYGAIGDGRSAALVAADGAVGWWAVPALDVPPVFAAIFDPEAGGTFTLDPAVL